MPALSTNQRTANPVSRVSYRLMAVTEAGPWRITRSAPSVLAVSLTHLKGNGDNLLALPADLVDRFTRGYDVGEVSAPGHGSACIAQIVMADFTKTAHHLIQSARNARIVYYSGMPGMRSRCRALLLRYEEASFKAHEGWQAMATVWSNSFGRETQEVAPDWMLASWETGQIPWDRNAALKCLIQDIPQ